MLGLVLADNLLALYVFWELTTVFSYTLIGHNPVRSANRRSATQALLVTTAGGLAMLVGIVMLGEKAGSYLLSDIVADPPVGWTVTVAIVLILIGALSSELPSSIVVDGKRIKVTAVRNPAELPHRELGVDIALDPLEGTTICAKNLPNALTVIAVAAKGSLLNAPDVYMEKIAIGPGYPPGIVSLRRSASENLTALAEAKGVPVSQVTACILDRPRHAQLIEEIRALGAAIRLIGDGDVAGVMHVAEPDKTGIDMYMGSGGAPEGVLAAAALKCMGGQMWGRLLFRNDDERGRAAKAGITDLNRIYSRDEMVTADVIFSATGVTNGSIVRGLRREPNFIETETILMRSKTGSVRRVFYRNPIR